MARYIAAAKVADVLEGTAICVEIEGDSIAIFNVHGQFYATSDTCTHADASLAEGIVEGDQVECPLHGARFNIKTGEVLCAPAYADLQTYPVRIIEDTIEIAFDG